MSLFHHHHHNSSNHYGRGIGGIFSSILRSINTPTNGRLEEKDTSSLTSKEHDQPAETSVLQAGLKIAPLDIKKKVATAKRSISSVSKTDDAKRLKKDAPIKKETIGNTKRKKAKSESESEDIFTELFDHTSEEEEENSDSEEK